MAAEDISTQSDPSSSNPQGVQVLLDERDLRSVYANAYRIHTSSEEVIIDLGFNMPNPNQQGSGAQSFRQRRFDFP